MENYIKALRAGQKEYQKHLFKGLYPYPPCLEEILPDYMRYPVEHLGIIQVPSERMIGTSTSGRKTAFSPSFMPLLESDTEFASKWIELCKAHEEEGIREPVIAYEYMNHYFVTEGNKRVSVLKFYDAPTIPATVTRILPPKNDTLENRLYYEYLDFSKITNLRHFSLSRLGDYTLLLKRLGKNADQPWDEEETGKFRSFFRDFTEGFHHLGGKKLPITPGDALLVYLKIYQDYDQNKEKSSSLLQKELSQIWDDVLLRCHNNSAALFMQPSASAYTEPKRSFLERLLPSSSPRIKVAFLHSRDAKTSHWTYHHELGRAYLEQTFGDQLVTSVYNNLTAETAEAVLEQVISDGNHIIFTTAAGLIEPSLMAAIRHPHIKVLNCSLNCSHRYIRTYYGRMYEAMFLTGAIAGAVSPSGRIGYVADFPTYGRIADINAFAIGAKMINPRAVIDLQWFSALNWDQDSVYKNNDTIFLLGPEVPDTGKAPGPYGLYRIADEGSLIDVATPIWHWGKFYELLIRSAMSDSWRQDDMNSDYKALNYWWGISSGILDVISSRKLYSGTEKLIQLLRQSIIQGSFHPFQGILRSQTEVIQSDPEKTLSPIDIITMDWLNENVIGHIPALEEITPATQEIMRFQGIGSQEQQWHSAPKN